MNDVAAQLIDSGQRDRIVRRFGAGALNWLEGLPARAQELADDWELTLLGAAPHGQTSVVVRCRQSDGSAAILKLSPDPALIAMEGRTLGLWAPTRRVPDVYRVDPRRGGLLMEAIEPGDSIAQGGVLPPLTDIGELIAELHSVPAPESVLREMYPLDIRINFVFELWERRRAEGPAAEVVPASMVHHGHALARALACARENVVPLHGDLHPGNVLVGGPERGLVAVDPRGCVGDPAADAVDWAVWRAASVGEVRERVEILAPAIGVPPKRLMDWCRALAPLLAVGLADKEQTATPEYAAVVELAES
ncbi:aminoglycoside phosphotransferase family protein [Nocardiopsis ansamitocini]|nr:aminoglycoside phosphotransferase family protein [Nocardiopsis ansamitocini]